jgi:hypothetical protein
MTTKRKSEKRQFYGEASGLFLAHWFNGPGESPWEAWKTEFRQAFGPVSGTAESDAKARDRLVLLLRKLKQFVELARELYVDQGKSKSSPDWLMFTRLRDSINRDFANYPAYPQIAINPPVKNERGHFAPFFPSRRTYEWATSPVPTAQLQEMLAVKLIQDAEKQRWLHQVRECSVCSRWFFARRRGTHTCSRTCGKTEYQSSDRYKEWRRSHYMNHVKQQRIKKEASRL